MKGDLTFDLSFLLCQVALPSLEFPIPLNDLQKGTKRHTQRQTEAHRETQRDTENDVIIRFVVSDSN